MNKCNTRLRLSQVPGKYFYRKNKNVQEKKTNQVFVQNGSGRRNTDFV